MKKINITYFPNFDKLRVVVEADIFECCWSEVLKQPGGLKHCIVEKEGIPSTFTPEVYKNMQQGLVNLLTDQAQKAALIRSFSVDLEKLGKLRVILLDREEENKRLRDKLRAERANLAAKQTTMRKEINRTCLEFARELAEIYSEAALGQPVTAACVHEASREIERRFSCNPRKSGAPKLDSLKLKPGIRSRRSRNQKEVA